MRELGLDPKSSLISSYEAGRANPSFDMVLKLLRLGMYPVELFGEEIDGIIREYYLTKNDEKTQNSVEIVINGLRKLLENYEQIKTK